ncbi:lysosomal proton-coupled steroid conjugate and bile acid symporter SLC46A3-like [Convolutriloba macropyga]|uniref:lysosomal proton-coupled steroid conjugate and bile acid symporter SLC46A3-like n=1 Tax=Convolutriloba macropyga TaxID=536237 RepID=UPI003F520C42
MAEILANARSFISVEVYMILMSLASNMNYPSQQGLIFSRVCRDHYPDVYNISATCDNLTDSQEQDVSSIASYWNLVLNLLFYSPQLIALIVCGNLSDRYEPKLLLPFPSVLCLLATGVYLFEAFDDELPIWPYLIGNFLQGAGGGYICSFMLGYSYLSLKSSESNRTANMAFGETASILGIFLGLIICGPLIDHVGYTSVWIVNAALYSFCIIYSVFWIPSLSAARNRHCSTYRRFENEINESDSCCSTTFSFASVFSGLEFCFGSARNVKSAIVVVGLGYVIMICDLSGVADGSVSYLYTKSEPINFSQSEYSYFLGSKYLAACIGSMIILPLCSKFLNLSDISFALIGITVRMIVEIYTSLCNSKLMLFLVPLIAVLANIVAPSCRSLISKTVPSHQISSVFSLVAFCECLINIGGSTLFSAIYPSTTEWFSGFCYTLIAAILFTGFCVLICMKLKLTRDRFESSGDYTINCDNEVVDDYDPTMN